MLPQKRNNIKLIQSAPGVSVDLINCVITGSFPGKEDFIDFYLRFNGGYLETMHSHYYRDNFYTASEMECNTMYVEGFYFIPQHKDQCQFQVLLSIPRMRFHYSNYSEQAKYFAITYIPLAFDVSGNVYWIDTESGRIKFTDLKREDNILDNVAPSFLDFYENIEPTRRQ